MIQVLSWVEIWIDSASKEDFVYILILQQRRDGKLEVIDPQQNRAVSAVFDTYDDATTWLREDEYDLVEGRWSLEGLL